ncbi:MAG: DNA polymerase IV [Bifidobacteriaceae bacterium]|jgi:DNA polymerase-4|nr:DNA polymerase IV [Bifidobacteriaceae bacterium]
MDRVIMHVDMDAFFASVELVSRPDLRGKPVVVAGASERGVVVAATYEARAFGVHAGMPIARARRAAPGAVFIPPHREAYSAVSRGVMALLRDVTPLVETVSVDEAFLDVTGSLRRLGPARTIAEQIRAEIVERFAITASAGIGRSKSVAKIASEQAKPNGVVEVPAGETLAFLRPLPVDVLWGVGPAAGAALASLGVISVGDLADLPDPAVTHALGPQLAGHLLALARGIDDAPVVPEHEEKSISAETTFERDLPRSSEELRRAVIALADKTAWRLREAGLLCRTVGIKLRTADFKTSNRSRTLPAPTDSTKQITALALRLVAAVAGNGPVRLAGVRLENLVRRSGAPVQLAFGQDHNDSAELDRVRDQVRRRFGGSSLTPGSLIR